MFNKKPLLQKNRAGKVAFHMATIVDAVNALIEKKLLKVENNTMFIYKEILEAAPDQKAYVKNLFLYCRTKDILKANQTLYVKDIESTNIIAQYTNEKALLFL